MTVVGLKLPEENELVIAIIKKIMPYGAFCTLPEYGDMEAFMHISEVAPRWIKNIHEFISEGQKYVVKVHRLDREKGQVDVSIKRVNEEEKKWKKETMRNEKKSGKMLEMALGASKTGVTAAQATEAITKKYDDVYSCFEEASDKGEEALKGIELPAALKEQIVELAKKNIRKPVVEVGGIIKLVSHEADGMERIKKILTEAKKENKDAVIQYLGAPNYKLSLKAEDYKKGEKALGAINDRIAKLAQKNDCEFAFERAEK